LATGAIRITEDCVTLSVGDASFLIVWPSDRTSWNASRRSVIFANRDAFVEVVDGQRVGLGGGGTDGRAHRFGAGWVEATQWINKPHSTCPTDDPYWVNEVQVR